jgi:hypothetical protein
MSTWQKQCSERLTSQYCVYTRDERFLEVAEWITKNNIKFERHLNRTRFWVPDGSVLTEFLLRYTNVCPLVKERTDNNYASY